MSQSMRTLGAGVLGAFIVAVAALSAQSGPVRGAHATEATTDHTITVSASGKVSVVPDVARISLGVTITKPTVKAVRAAAARVITAAAAIMVVVFGSFVFEEIREIKVFGFGLGLAVFLDATLVRMVLVPATMALLGEGNWWMPPWLDRLVPRFSIESATPAAAEVDHELEPA